MDDVSRARWSGQRPKQPPFDTACIAPWISLEFDPSGWVYACCTSQLYPLGRIGEHRLSDLWNGSRAEVLRDALRRWDMSVACQPCRFQLEHGVVAPAAAEYDQYPLGSDGAAVPHMMVFALSNRCNLGCIMCNPALSSTLRRQAGMAPLTSPYGDEFFEDLEPLLGELKLAKFLGGEPFLAPEHHRVWKMLDALEQPPRIAVTTNGTVWTDTVDWLTERFLVDVSVSVDAATPDTYSAVRRGGDLGVVHQNLERFSQRCAERGATLHVSYCLMPQNAHELGPFLAWAEQYSSEAPASVNLVADRGLALFDLPTSELEAVHAMWCEQDSELKGRLDHNLGVWRAQLAQVSTVLAERAAGGTPRSTRARRADGATLVSARPPSARKRSCSDEIDRLSQWSDGGPVAVVTCDADGVITGVPSEHGRLGIVAEVLAGQSVSTLISRMEVTDGRALYSLDRDEDDERIVHTLVLSDGDATRGVEGSVLRMVHLGSDSGSVFLVAEDRLYDTKRRATGLQIRSRTPVGER